MKKILFIHSSLGGGGAERVLIDLLRNIDTTKFVVDFLLIFEKGIYLSQIPANINYIGSIYKQDRPFLKWFIARLHLGHLFENKEIRNIIKGHYDTIVSFMENIPLKYHSQITDLADNNVTWVHTDLLNNHYSRCSFMGLSHERKAYQSMDKIVFVSDTAKNNFKRLFGVSVDKLTVIHNPIDVDRILKMSNEPIAAKEKFTLCMVGRICPQKRYDRFIEAIRLLKNQGCDMLVDILGTGQDEDKIMQMSRDYGLSDMINFRGFCSNPYPYIKRADVLCLSSDSEGYPTVVCEAMVLGKPIVATNIVGSKDLLEHNKYGILTNLNPKSFAQGIYELYSSKDKLKHYQIMALEKAKSFGVENVMKSINEVL